MARTPDMYALFQEAFIKPKVVFTTDRSVYKSSLDQWNDLHFITQFIFNPNLYLWVISLQ